MSLNSLYAKDLKNVKRHKPRKSADSHRYHGGTTVVFTANILIEVYKMGVKTYRDRIQTNWNELSLERQAELSGIWNGHIADTILRRIEKHPQEHRESILQSVIRMVEA